MLIVVYDVNVLLIVLTTQRGGFDKVYGVVLDYTIYHFNYWIRTQRGCLA